MSAGRFKVVDALRRRDQLGALQPALAGRLAEVAAANAAQADHAIEDDRLRLVFACCHPAIDPAVRVPLTLREVCGLTTDEIAAAFLTAPAAMAQRIVRGKTKVRDAGVPFAIPTADELPGRLESVLAVVYLVFNEGYSATAGAALTRADLSGEAIRLGRLVAELLPDPAAVGLLALMLLQESRRAARTNPAGDIVLLEHQDRAAWDAGLIAEGLPLAVQALAAAPAGPYPLQAAIAAVHATAPTAADTDWRRIVNLYEAPARRHPVAGGGAEPGGGGGHAGRPGRRAGPGRRRPGECPLAGYHLAHAARADLLRRLGRTDEARTAYQQAFALAKQEPERRFLSERLARL